MDSPGVGESGIMDDIVKEYIPEAFAFIYVINSVNAGGIQRDRVRESSDIVYHCVSIPSCKNKGNWVLSLVC